MELILVAIIIIVGIFFFRKKKTAKNKDIVRNQELTNSTKSKQLSIDSSTGFVSIDELEFYGISSLSENNQFLVACQDRNSTSGRAILFDQGKLVWDKEFERPKDAVVSNEGYVLLNDWLFGEGLKGDFYLINPSGRILVKESFRANLDKPYFSDDYKIAWLTTKPSEAYDSSQLIVYNSISGEKLFQRNCLFGFINKGVVNTDNIEFNTEQNINYRLSLSGDILNEAEVDEAIERNKLNSNNHWDVLSVVENKISQLDEKNIEEALILNIINTLENLDSKKIDRYSLAKIQRYLGELKLKIERKKEALSHFENALEHNEKIGVKKIIASLKKELE